MSIRSRLFSPLDNSRPDIEKAAKGEATGGFNDRQMPSDLVAANISTETCAFRCGRRLIIEDPLNTSELQQHTVLAQLKIRSN